jgi:hypothetical protein
VSPHALFLTGEPFYERQVAVLLRRLPPLSGTPILLERVRGLRDRRGDAHAGAFLRARRIAFDCSRGEFPRIFIHELFHFVWLRLGNPRRHSFESLLHEHWRARFKGELGWSAEWRKRELRAADVHTRSPRWREYCCESFCDTAAWMYSGLRRHREFTLAGRFRRARHAWFRDVIESGELSI